MTRERRGVRRETPLSRSYGRPGRSAGVAATGALLLAAAALAAGIATACGGKDGGPEAESRTAATERYYVRLRPSADPGAVAERHGVEPIEVITEDATAFYASLTEEQVESLDADSLVVSVSREIHQGEDTVRAPIRGVSSAPADTGDG